MPAYQAVLFDAGDTLIDFYSADVRVADTVREWTGREASAEQIARAFEAAWHHAFDGKADLLWVDDEETERRYWGGYYTGWLRAVGIEPVPGLVEQLVEDTLRLDSYDAFPDAAETLAALHSQGLRLVLISNAFPSMQKIMQQLDLERRFDACLYSWSAGYEKPHPAIFELALKAAGVPASAACFVDDTAGHIEAAISLGIGGFLLDRHNRHPGTALPRITGLRELLPRLSRR
ncbi:MAG: HAD family hydrolase [Chloroflexia bacterium]